MGDTTSNRVQFQGVTWIASRPQVLPLVIEALNCHWGACLTFRGTRDQLVAAGIAPSEMFEDMGKSAQRRRWDGFGNAYFIRRRRTDWVVELRLQAESPDDLPTDEHPKDGSWWKKHGDATRAATAAILARLTRP